MKKKKKAATIFITAALLMGFAACSAPDSSANMESAVSRNSGQRSGNIKAQTTKNVQNIAQKQDMNKSLSPIYPARESYLGEPKWGYIDASGKFVLRPKFTQALRFQSNGLAAAGENDKVGLIDRTGKYVVAPIYTDIGSFSEGLAVAMDDNGFVVLEEDGDVISQTLPYISRYQSNRAVYYIQSQNGTLLYGYLDETGKTVIEPVYEYAGEFEGDRAVVKIPGKGYSLIDKQGRTLKNFEYSYVMSISDGMMAFTPMQNGKYGYLNDKGNVAIAPAFLFAQDFNDGAAVVNGSEHYSVKQYGLINKKGKYLIKPQYNEILQLGEGMAALGIPIDADNSFAGSKYALTTRNGEILSDFAYYSIGSFNDGIASVYNNTNSFFIDKTGKRPENLPLVEGIGKMELLDGLIYADIDQRPYYMNTHGGIVYQPAKSMLLKSGIMISEEKFRPNRNYLVYYPVLDNLESHKVEETVNTKLRDMWTDVKIKPNDNLDYHYESHFSIGFSQKNLLVLQESGYDYPFGAAHGMPVMQYAHVDTKSGIFYQLEELFKDGSDYAEVLSGIVEEQIKKYGEEMAVWPDSYKGIKPDQPFYLTADALMLYFEPYEISPYAAGFPTFSVPFTEISSIIDKKGKFWRSFN